ncbi:MAG: hypothetical protein QN162_15190 [Armatimonadota bacterium]|nr:hypothetical protein [Armatimonadota bacterium]MDR7534664.1 hypothetical protein [Armatimonadota bacterium]MDR7573958.1 hypothetical protein [Armatimonadota bacterium]
MVIGGHAAILYSEPRLTRNIDNTGGVGPDRLGDLLEIVHAAGLVPAPGAEEVALRNYVLPCADTATGIDVDLMTRDAALDGNTVICICC